MSTRHVSSHRRRPGGVVGWLALAWILATGVSAYPQAPAPPPKRSPPLRAAPPLEQSVPEADATKHALAPKSATLAERTMKAEVVRRKFEAPKVQMAAPPSRRAVRPLMAPPPSRTVLLAAPMPAAAPPAAAPPATPGNALVSGGDAGKGGEASGFLHAEEAATHTQAAPPAEHATPARALATAQMPALAVVPRLVPTEVQQAAPPTVEIPQAPPAPQSETPKAPPCVQESGKWMSDKLNVHYGATFNLVDDHYTVDAEEAYEFVDTGDPGAPRIVAYCVMADEAISPGLKFEGAVPLCPQYAPVEEDEIRFQYRYGLAANQYRRIGYLQEEFVVFGRLVGVQVVDARGRCTYRMLNYFLKLQDAYGNSDNRLMSTLELPRNTFVAMEGAQKENRPGVDVVDTSRPLLSSTLNYPPYVATRINPRVPGALRFLVQKCLSFGIGNIFLQWALLSSGSLAPVAFLGWAARHLWRRRKSHDDADDA